MTRIETALQAMLEVIDYSDSIPRYAADGTADWDPPDVLTRMLATPTGQALSSLVEAAEAHYAAAASEACPLCRAVDAFRAATEPQP